MNLNIHDSLTDPVNRLLNAVEPDSYVRPHRHPDKSETLLAVAGAFDLLLFDETGALRERRQLGGASGALVLEYTAGTWHSLVAREPGSVFFEVKTGPYAPLDAADFLAGWPTEHSEGVPAALDWLRRAQPGDRFGAGA